MYTVSPKNDINVGRYSFNVCLPILIIFGRNIADRVNYQTAFYFPTSPN